MEFYGRRGEPILWACDVSIPNGMEFYLRLVQILNRTIQVSIPNGMEFYPAPITLCTEQMLFQFPTGWNSTSSRTKGSSLGEIRFNSQRDGILRDFDMSWKDATSGFQFPTGWNSTPIVHIEGSALYPFQFPTGWNYAEAGDD